MKKSNQLTVPQRRCLEAIQSGLNGHMSGQRLLCSDRHVAVLPHGCDRCMCQIQPGEYYERLVFLHMELRRVVVLKYHLDPECTWPDWPEESEYAEEAWLIAA